MLDSIFDVVKTVTGVGVVGLIVSVGVSVLKQVGLVKQLRLEGLLDQAADRIVAYVQDESREAGTTGPEQREQAARELSKRTGIDLPEAEQRVRAAYQKMKQSKE